jgi:putative FmdB family regulatory protein
MPAYLFRCAKCFESWQVESRMSEDVPEPPVCECGAVMKRRWTSPGIVLKGSGWGKDKL